MGRAELQAAANFIRDGVLVEIPPMADLDIVSHYGQSQTTLRKYVTLDWKHADDIERVLATVETYIEDAARDRPLNILLQAGPGTGKSYFVNCVAEQVPKLTNRVVECNMALVDGLLDFQKFLEEAIGLVKHKDVPLLFIDEFDSNPAHIPYLLPVLWEGKTFGTADPIGRMVIFLAGSGEAIERLMTVPAHVRSDSPESGAKLIDLLSRVNGGRIRIPDLDLVERDRNRKVDKVCIAVTLIRKRFGDRLKKVPWALLQFIGQRHFRYGARSIAHFVDCIDRSALDGDRLDVEKLNLDVASEQKLRKSSLVYHLVCDEGTYEIVNDWDAVKTCKIYVRIA